MLQMPFAVCFPCLLHWESQPVPLLKCWDWHLPTQIHKLLVVPVCELQTCSLQMTGFQSKGSHHFKG